MQSIIKPLLASRLYQGWLQGDHGLPEPRTYNKARATILSRVPDVDRDSYLKSKIKPPALLSEIVY